MTGGSRGICAAIARRLAQAGAAVALTSVSASERARAVAKEIEDDGGQAEDIAAAVAFRASPNGRYITGTALAVDGGYTA